MKNFIFKFFPLITCDNLSKLLDILSFDSSNFLRLFIIKDFHSIINFNFETLPINNTNRS